MASQVSLPATPQQNTSYDTYMQSLQQKLSSISMQNAATLGPLSPQTTLISLENAVLPSLETTLQLIDKLHVDSSAPTSGTATTEMLSPVQEFETAPFPGSPPPPASVDPPNAPNTPNTPKHTYKSLNNELSKINARKDSTAPSSEVELKNETPELPKLPELPETPDNYTRKEPEQPEAKPVEKVRRVSRFKVSVVAEPDPTKLIIKPEPKHPENPGNIDTLHDSLTLINNTMLQLQENVQTSYLSQARTLIAAAPSGYTTQNHADPATIGNTAHNKIERKISMDNLKTRTTTPLKKSLSYNDLANEIANLFSKPSPKVTNKQGIIARVDPVVTSSNPRKISGNGRRMSKTFRRTPTIIVHPPDESADRITNSCPNIHALIFKENGGVSTCASAHDTSATDKDELNHSCPDINVLIDCYPSTQNLQNNLSRSLPSINTLNDVNCEVSFNNYNYQKYQPLNISFSECLNELDALKNEVNDIKKECECLLYGCTCDKPQYRNTFKLTTKRKITQKLYDYNRPERKTSLNKHDSYTRTVSEPNIFKNVTKPAQNTNDKSPKKHEITPTELLKHKIKQSLSMYDLNTVKHPNNYDNYVTIHGGMKFPKHLTDFTLDNYKEHDRVVHDKRDNRELDKDNNLLAIVKCCCGLENCQNGRLQVVPITFQQLMDFNCEYNMNETFEDMLGRQQAELNALIEAHRKQQIEYMKSITEVSKNSNSNRKDS